MATATLTTGFPDNTTPHKGLCGDGRSPVLLCAPRRSLRPSAFGPKSGSRNAWRGVLHAWREAGLWSR